MPVVFLLLALASCSTPNPPSAVEGSVVGVVFSPQDTLLGSLFGPARGGGEVISIPEDEVLAFLAEAEYLDGAPTLDELTEDESGGFLHLRASIADHGGVTSRVGSRGNFQVEAPGDGRVAVCWTRANPGSVQVSVKGCRLVDPRETPGLQVRVGESFHIIVSE